MSENNRLILVFYIDVSHVCKEDIPDYMSEVASELSKNDNNTDKYFIPIYEGDSRLECINPVMLSEEEYVSVKQKVNEIDKIFKDLIKDNNNVKTN